MTFTPKSWGNFAAGGTPLTAAALIDLETRLANYTDVAVGTATGVTYYVDTAGDDSNAGTTIAAPWASVSKVNSSTFNPGDKVLFKRGGVWRGTTMTLTAAKHTNVTFGVYGAATGAMPILSGGTVISGFVVSSGSTYASALASLPGAPPIVTFTSANTTTVLQAGTGSGTLTSNQYYFTGGNLYVNLGGTNPSTGTVEVATLTLVVSSAAPNTRFIGLDFRYGANGAVGINPANGWYFESCGFRYSTYTSNSGTLQVSSGSSVSRAPNRVLNCFFDQLANDGIWIHDTQDVEIGNCVFTNVGTVFADVQSDGIQFENTYDVAPNSDNFWIHDCYVNTGANSPKGCIIINTDNTIANATSSGIIERCVCIGGNYGIAAGASNIIVRDNILRDQVSSFGGGIHVANNFAGEINDVTIVRNLIFNQNRSGIIIQDTTVNRRRWIIANNTMVDCTVGYFMSQAPLSGFFVNNIMWYTSVAPTFCMVQNYRGVVTGETLTWDYNLMHDAAGTGTYRAAVLNYDTVAAWKIGTGYDTHAVTSDPTFTLAAGHDYTLQYTSPAIGAGVAVIGVGQRPLGTLPDIGYAEHA